MLMCYRNTIFSEDIGRQFANIYHSADKQAAERAYSKGNDEEDYPRWVKGQ